MEKPKGFVVIGQEHLVCRIRKRLYSLKQAPRQWYRKCDDFIQSIGFCKSDEDHCLLLKTILDGSPIYLIIYVDDMLLSSRHAGELADLVRQLRLRFAMKDLGSARHILGMQSIGSRINDNCPCLKLTTFNVSWNASTCNQPNLLRPRSPLAFSGLIEIIRHPVLRGKSWSRYLMHKQSAP